MKKKIPFRTRPQNRPAPFLLFSWSLMWFFLFGISYVFFLEVSVVPLGSFGSLARATAAADWPVGGGRFECADRFSFVVSAGLHVCVITLRAD